MTSFWDTVDPATFTDVPAEEVGLAILRWWNENNLGSCHPAQFEEEVNRRRADAAFAGVDHDLALRVFLEGWSWLTAAALIMPAATDGRAWYIRTRRGRLVGGHLTETALKAEIALSRDLLHPSLQAAPWEFFGRGYFDSAVFEACKGVEVRVRKLGGFPDNLLGRDLMRQALPSGVPLCDVQAVRGEQEAMVELFAGAIGVLKNPTSHRDEVIATANEAAEALMVASHLMRILDRAEARLERAKSWLPE